MDNNPKIFPLSLNLEPCIDLMDLPTSINSSFCYQKNWGNTTCAPDLLIFPGPWSLFWLPLDFMLLFHCCQFERPIAGSNQRALLNGEFSSMCLIHVPLGDRRYLCEWSPVCVLDPLFLWEGSVLLQSPFFFLLTKEVLVWGTGGVALWGSTIPEGPSPIPSALWPSGSRAPHLLQKVSSPPRQILGRRRRNLLPGVCSDLLAAFIFERPLANSPLISYPEGFWVHDEDATNIFMHGIFWISLFLITISIDKNSNYTTEKPVF